MRPTIGVLALQGDFAAHRRCLEDLGASVELVRTPDRLAAIDALVIPGGESTTLLRLLGETGLSAIRRFAQERPTFGTCAGAILLASAVESSGQALVGAIDIVVRRNAFGRQIDSSIQEGLVAGIPTEMMFIRAPRIVRVGPGVEVVATLQGEPVAVREGRVLAATFHSELGDDMRLHRMFLELVFDRRTRRE
jgi:5'-phosphate synthase pdxT subunit